MKRVMAIATIFILIFSIFSNVCAYSTAQFSIDIPSTYTKVGLNSFTNTNGNNVNIQVTTTNYSGKDPYTEQNLNDLVDEIYKQIEDSKDQLVAEAKKQYGSQLTDEELAGYVSSFKCNYIDTKEITKFSKNEYKCFHIIGNFTMGDLTYFANQYSVISGNNVYTVTVSGQEKEEFETDEIKNMIESFTIKNFQGVKKNETSTKTMTSAITAIILFAIAIIGGMVNKVKAKKKENDTNKVEDNKIEK